MTQSLVLSLKIRINRLRQTLKLAEENGLSLILNEDSARLDENEALLDYIKENGITIYEVTESGENGLNRVVGRYLSEESANKNSRPTQEIVQRMVQF
jgi:hypothetical protein